MKLRLDIEGGGGNPVPPTGNEKKARALMDDMGVSFDGVYFDTYERQAFLDAPAGFVWENHGTHCVKVGGATTAGLWKSALAELKAGLRPCDDIDCNICRPDEDDGQPTEQQEWRDFDPDC